MTRRNASQFAVTLLHFRISDLDGQLASFCHGVTSIRRQVHQNQLDLSGISQYRNLFYRGDNSNLDMFSNYPREHAAGFHHYRIEIKHHWRKYMLATEGE